MPTEFELTAAMEVHIAKTVTADTEPDNLAPPVVAEPVTYPEPTLDAFGRPKP